MQQLFLKLDVGEFRTPSTKACPSECSCKLTHLDRQFQPVFARKLLMYLRLQFSSIRRGISGLHSRKQYHVRVCRTVTARLLREADSGPSPRAADYRRLTAAIALEHQAADSRFSRMIRFDARQSAVVRLLVRPGDAARVPSFEAYAR